MRDYLVEISQRPRAAIGFTGQLRVSIFLLIVLLTVFAALHVRGFFMGGNFHPLPCWRGWGKMHSQTAGDFFLYVDISPHASRMTGMFAKTSVQGTGHLCTPKGEHFSLRLNGYMPPHIYLNTVGEPIQLGMDNWRALLPAGRDSRPSFSLWGRWGRGEIVADDRSTLSHAFLRDGRLRPTGSHVSPYETEDLQVILREGTYAEWEAVCSNAGR